MNQQVGKVIVLFGLLIVAAGLIWYFLGDKLSWLGKLPGDIRIERDNFRLYFPITTMILASVAISILLAVIRRWF
ncbi:MAG: DUF2905 domain-containing protein [Chitinophagales bacterium]|nr:DUF2905 domain-containing protein [Chitinophagales bacterium]